MLGYAPNDANLIGGGAVGAHPVDSNVPLDILRTRAFLPTFLHAKTSHLDGGPVADLTVWTGCLDHFGF